VASPLGAFGVKEIAEAFPYCSHSAFCLAIGLVMISGSHVEINFHISQELHAEAGGGLGVSIRDDTSRESMKRGDWFNEQVSSFCNYECTIVMDKPESEMRKSEFQDQPVDWEDSIFLAYGSIQDGTEMLYSTYGVFSSKVLSPGNPSRNACTAPMILIQPRLYCPAPAGHWCAYSNKVDNHMYPFLLRDI